MDHDYETVVHLPEDFFGGHQHRYGTEDGNDDDSENDDAEHDDDGGDYVEVKRLSSGKGMGTSIADHSTTTLVCCNDLCNIPVEIGYLRNLTLLDLSKNSLTTLPDSITQLTKLADLKLSYNFLESIPSTIGKLTKLTSLSLGNNRLTQIPSQIGQLKDLAYFDLSDNPLTVLPAEIARLQYLRRLRLDRCPLLKEFVHVPLHAPPTLLELAARVVVRHGIEVSPIIPTHFKTYLKTAQRCSFCQGPYFETRFKRGKLIEKNNNLIPLEYTLCMPHWNTETQRCHSWAWITDRDRVIIEWKQISGTAWQQRGPDVDTGVNEQPFHLCTYIVVLGVNDDNLRDSKPTLLAPFEIS
ncbi:hypothetical protein BGZ98_004465 [Dissophora globulifera]|nr:hypothetical protein BGZ98_004465 [Dissophora globulifera]